MVTPLYKTWVAGGLAILALIEFFTAMYLFGRSPKQGPKVHAKLMLRVHRVVGYVFVFWFAYVVYLGVQLLGQLAEHSSGYTFNGFVGPKFYHAMLGVVVGLLLAMKIGFVRLWKTYRTQAKLLGFILTLGTLTAWLIAGWFYLIEMGGPVIDR